MIDITRHPLAANLDPKTRQVLAEIVDELDEALEAAFKSIDQKLGAANQRIVAIEARLDGMEATIANKIVAQVNARLGRTKPKE